MGRNLTAFTVQRADLQKPVVRASHEVADFMMRASTIAVADVGDPERLVDATRAMVEHELAASRRLLSLDAISRAFDLSPATLHRRLAAEGTKFITLRDEVLNAAAKRLLRETTAGLSVITEQLGYSEERSFRRAFLRWNGVAPSEFRRSAKR